MNYTFDLKVHFNAPKLSLTFWMNSHNEEYICPNKDVFETLMAYFKERINLLGFHETYTAIKKIGKGNFASVKTNNFLKDFFKKVIIFRFF